MLVRYRGYVFSQKDFVEQIVEVKGFWYSRSNSCCIIYATETMNNIVIPMSLDNYINLLDLVESNVKNGITFVNITDYDCFECCSEPNSEEIDNFNEIMKTRTINNSVLESSSIEAKRSSSKIETSGYIS